jgi:hypothetical protein
MSEWFHSHITKTQTMSGLRFKWYQNPNMNNQISISIYKGDSVCTGTPPFDFLKWPAGYVCKIVIRVDIHVQIYAHILPILLKLIWTSKSWALVFTWSYEEKLHSLYFSLYFEAAHQTFICFIISSIHKLVVSHKPQSLLLS